jgi:preprotein translocase subunit SecF
MQQKHRFFQLIPPNTTFDFVGNAPRFLIMSTVILLVSVMGLLVRGINWGVEFVGGTEIQVAFNKLVSIDDVRKTVGEAGFENISVQQFGDPKNNEFLVRVERISVLTEQVAQKIRENIQAALGADLLEVTSNEREGDRVNVFVKGTTAPPPATAEGQPPAAPVLTDKMLEPNGQKIEAAVKAAGVELRTGEPRRSAVIADKEEHLIFVKGVSSRVVESLRSAFGSEQVVERRTDYVDATVAEELRTDGVLALLYALGVMLLYIAIRFDFYFSPGAVVALFHDVLVAVGVVTWAQLDFDLTLVAAFLTIIGYSINDTIVIYDRVREVLTGKEGYSELTSLVNRSINETLSRTLLTSASVFLVCVALFLWGGRVLEGFALAMCVGIITGTYSSFAIATPTYLWLKRKFPEGILQPVKT